jgi:hypothetical protein
VKVCSRLRWKGYDEEMEPDEVMTAALRNNVPYLCLRTCQPWGIDDRPAIPERCVHGRSCFTPQGGSVDTE